MKSTETTRILLKMENKIKRLVNITPLYKDGVFYEYKISLNGFPQGGWNLVKKAKIHSTDGFIESKGERKLKGTHVEIGYHRDGKTAYKDVNGEWNLKPMVSNLPIKKIKKPRIFFRIVGFQINNLLNFEKAIKSEYDLLGELPYGLNEKITCDFHMSKRPEGNKIRYSIAVKENSPFKDSFFIDLEDPDERIDLHLHFYKTNITDGPYFSIIKNSLFGRITQKIHYYIYYCQNFLSKTRVTFVTFLKK